MTARPDSGARLALKQACDLCGAHHDALQEALADLRQQPLSVARLEHMDKADRRLLDQFAYRYTRLQDDMGAKLMPALLRALGEDPAAMPMLDRLNRLEQIGWLGSAEGWNELRRIRNEFTHDYPEGVVERLARLELAMQAADRLLEIYRLFKPAGAERFPARRTGLTAFRALELRLTTVYLPDDYVAIAR